jgi:Phospholipase_D-nuclease N-terminal
MSARFVLVVVLAVGLAVAWEAFCLHDLVRVDRVRYLPKWGWALVCLLSIPWGGIIYLIVGRTGD